MLKKTQRVEERSALKNTATFEERQRRERCTNSKDAGGVKSKCKHHEVAVGG